MWFVYAFSAAVIWGVSYAASGRVIERGMSPLVFFFFYAVFATVVAALALGLTGKLARMATEVRVLEADWPWLVIAVITSAAGALLIYMAIGEKNATVASLIEISYPLFVALFAWLFFREAHLNWATFVGGAMILGGVGVVFLGNRS